MKRKGLTSLLFTVAMGALAAAHATSATKTITFKGSNNESETIALDAEADAQIYVAVTDTGIEITLPVSVDVKCYGDETEDGYCLLAVNEGVTVAPPQPVDTDGDSVPDSSDNCPNSANANQADNDSDGIGNVCDSTPNGPGNPDPDSDGDGVSDSSDNCVNDANADQADNDNDGIGNVCDSTPNGNGTVTPGGYCSGASGNVACSSDLNLDDVYGADTGWGINIVSGAVVAMPFTLKSVAASDQHYFGLEFFTDMPTVSLPQAFRVWFSSTPGGNPLSSLCDSKLAQARGRILAAQFPNSQVCALPVAGGVYYANFGMVEPFGRTYKFSMERQYQP